MRKVRVDVRRPIWICVLFLGVIVAQAARPGYAAIPQSLVNQLLERPANIELNLRYGELAERQGELRKALQTYERLVANHPDNADFRRRLARVKRLLKPAVTRVSLTIGATYTTNPRQLPDAEQREETGVLNTRIVLYDERTVKGVRWRSDAIAEAHFYDEVSELTNGRVSFATGPVIDLHNRLRLHIAPEATYRWLDGEQLYSEGAINLIVQGLHLGTIQSATVRIGYRDVNSEFSDSSGIVVDVRGRFSLRDKIKTGDTVYFFPRFRYSEPTGDAPNGLFSSALFPGNYYEIGARLAYFLPILQGKVHVGAAFGAYSRHYDQNVLLATKDREDFLIEPSAHLIFRNLAKTEIDLRIDYRYQNNDSNDPAEDFENHIVGIRTVRRF